MNGSWVFVWGNHDKNNGVKPLCRYMVCQIGPQRAFVSHYPWWYHTIPEFEDAEGFTHATKAPQWPEVSEIIKTCDFAVCGHVHEIWHVRKWDQTITINVGVDANKFMPITDDELLRLVNKYRRIHDVDAQQEGISEENFVKGLRVKAPQVHTSGE